MKKIWKRLFVALVLMFLIFAFTILISNITILRSFFVWYEKGILTSHAQNVVILDLSDRNEAARKLETIESTTNTKIAIYEDDVLIYYTTNRRAGSFGGRDGFDVDVFDNVIMPADNIIYQSDADEYGGIFSESRGVGGGHILYSLAKNNRQVVISMELSLINNSASVAGVFCIIITGICLIIALVWAVYYSRRFARPISEMNRIAIDMANLDFSRRVEPNSNDEIGQLAQSVNNLSDSLYAAMTELQEKNARLEHEIEQERKLDTMRKRFVANVSHELKTPISIIQGYAEGLRDGMAEDEQTRGKYVDVILDESDRMYNLVISLLELSKAEGGLKVNPVYFDLSASVLSALDLLSTSLDEKKISPDFDMPEKLIVYGDVMLIEQAIRNYLSNAVSHAQTGGQITVYTEPYNENIRFCVYNRGSVIPEDEMQDIWEPFYRADQSHNRSEGRYGLGLSFVKAIMLSHKNDFGVFSTGDGVTFWFEIRKQP